VSLRPWWRQAEGGGCTTADLRSCGCPALQTGTGAAAAVVVVLLLLLVVLLTVGLCQQACCQVRLRALLAWGCSAQARVPGSARWSTQHQQLRLCLTGSFMSAAFGHRQRWEAI
jgi:hypothetical protein